MGEGVIEQGGIAVSTAGSARARDKRVLDLTEAPRGPVPGGGVLADIGAGLLVLANARSPESRAASSAFVKAQATALTACAGSPCPGLSAQRRAAQTAAL